MIDLYSDTVTKPTQGMFEAMRRAEVGDDQRGDDPTARLLEERVATELGQARALLLPSATMANQIAVVAQAEPGAQLLCHRTAHVLNFEAGGIAANAGVQALGLEGPHGTFTGDDVLEALSPNDPHCSPTRVVVVENTSNLGGGSVWPDDRFDGVVAACARHDLRLHLDGARLFNAAIAAGRPLEHWSARANSVQLCFSKGLGCPFGAVLAGSAPLIGRARRIRQRMGGALRQAGVLAAAMLYALDHHVERLEQDHARLRRIREGLSDVSELELADAQTNILFFGHRERAPGVFAAELKAEGVWVSHVGQRLRLCTHLGIRDEDAERACAIIRRVARQ